MKNKIFRTQDLCLRTNLGCPEKRAGMGIFMVKRKKGKNSSVVWNHRIYMDEKVSKKPVKYRRRIEHGKIIPGCFCIALAANEQNSLDIYASGEFWFKYQAEAGIEIVGLAADRQGAIELVERMVSDIINEEGEFNSKTVLRYFR